MGFLMLIFLRVFEFEPKTERQPLWVRKADPLRRARQVGRRADSVAPPSDDPVDEPGDDEQSPVDVAPPDDEGALEGPPPGYGGELPPSVEGGSCQAVPAASLYSMVAVLLAELRLRRRRRRAR